MSGLSLPEFAIRDAIEEAIELMLVDGALLEDMLAERPQAERDSYRTALLQRVGKVRLGWAMDAPEDWLVTVLKVQDIPHETIGMLASLPSEDALAVRILAADVGITDDVAVTFTTGTPAVGEDVGEVLAAGLLRIGTEISTYAIETGVCRLMRRGVRGTKAVPHAADAAVTFFETSQRVGWPETVVLRVDVLGSNAPFVMLLARCLQAFLVRASAIFHEHGYDIEEVTSGDLATRPQFYPAHLFLRTLTIKLTTTLSLPESYPVLTGAVISVTTEGAIGGLGEAGVMP